MSVTLATRVHRFPLPATVRSTPVRECPLTCDCDLDRRAGLLAAAAERRAVAAELAEVALDGAARDGQLQLQLTDGRLRVHVVGARVLVFRHQTAVAPEVQVQRVRRPAGQRGRPTAAHVGRRGHLQKHRLRLVQAGPSWQHIWQKEICRGQMNDVIEVKWSL